MAGQYNGLADLLLAASGALDRASPTSDFAVPQWRTAPSKRWNDDSSSGSESDASSTTPHSSASSRKRTTTGKGLGKHPYNRRKTKAEQRQEEEDEEDKLSLSGPAQHNEVEKRRRAYLSSCYIDLKMLVPSIAQTKASNVTILQTAAGHVKELDATAKKVATQLRAARRKREQLEQQVAALRAKVPATPRQEQQPTWSPPHVGESGDSSNDSPPSGMEDDLVPDTFNADVDDVAPSANLVSHTPSFGDATASLQSSPVAWGKKMHGLKGRGSPGLARSGIDLLMLLAASADARAEPPVTMVATTCAAEVAMVVDVTNVASAAVDVARGRGRDARKPARFL